MIVQDLRLFVMVLALGMPVPAQAPAASCCQMKAVSDDESPAHLKITVTNISQASVIVVVARGQPEMDFRVRVVSDTGREAGRIERAKRSPTDSIPL